MFDVLEEFTYHFYGHVKQNDVHEVIKLHFEEKTKPNCTERPVGNIKSVEPTTFPACRSVLTQHMKQAWYIPKLYKSACWKHLEGFNLLTVMWFGRQQVPQEIEDVQALHESDDEAIEYKSDEEENGSDIEN